MRGVKTDDKTLEEMRSMHAAGYSLAEISRRTGVSPRTAGRYLGKGNNGRIAPEILSQIRGMIEDGVPYAEIARTLPITHKTLIRRFGPSPYRRGELTGFYNRIRELEGNSFAPFGDIRGKVDSGAEKR